MGSTFLRAIDRYAKVLRRYGGKLTLIGVSEPLHEQLCRTEMLAGLGEENIYRAARVLGESA